MQSNENTSTRDGIHSIAHNATFLMLSKVLEKGFRFVYIIILARNLGPEDVGLYNFGISWYLIFLPLSMWGLHMYLSLELGSKLKPRAEVVSRALHVRILASVIGFTACLLLGLLTVESSRLVLLIMLFSVALFGRSFAVFGRSLFIAEEQSSYSAISETGFRIVEFVVGSLWLLLGGGLLGASAVHAFVWLSEGTVMSVFSMSKLDLRMQRIPLSHVRELVVQCLPFALYTLLWMGFMQIGMVLLKNLASDQAHLGYYGISFQLISNLVLLPQVFSQAAMPVLSRVHIRGSRENEIFLETTIKLSSLISTSLILFMLFFREWGIELLFSHEYGPAGDVLLVFSFCSIFLFAIPNLDKIVLSSGKTIQAVVMNLLAFLLTVGLTLVLYPRYSFLSPALAMTCSSFVLFMIILFFIHTSIFRLNWGRMVIRPYAYSASTLGLALILAEHTWIGFLSGLSAILLLFIFGGVFSKDEKAYFRKLVPISLFDTRKSNNP